MFVDYAGQTIGFTDGLTGEVVTCQLFVAVLGASSYTYAEATLTQSLPDWCSSHERAFKFIGGAPAQVVSDNLKAGITKACFYGPAVNRTYADLAARRLVLGQFLGAHGYDPFTNLLLSPSTETRRVFGPTTYRTAGTTSFRWALRSNTISITPAGPRMLTPERGPG